MAEIGGGWVEDLKRLLKAVIIKKIENICVKGKHKKLHTSLLLPRT